MSFRAAGEESPKSLSFTSFPSISFVEDTRHTSPGRPYPFWRVAKANETKFRAFAESTETSSSNPRRGGSLTRSKIENAYGILLNIDQRAGQCHPLPPGGEDVNEVSLVRGEPIELDLIQY